MIELDTLFKWSAILGMVIAVCVAAFEITRVLAESGCL